MISSFHHLSLLWTAMAWDFLVMLSLAFPLERLWPARDQLFLRSGWATDCVFFIVQHSLLEGAMLSLFAGIFSSMPSFLAIEMIHRFFEAQPVWFQLLVVMLMADFSGYGYHRCMHGNRWLWPLHAIHHSVEEPDWLSAHREHPVDTILGSFCITVQFVFLGVPMALATPILLFRGVWSLYLHSNFDLGIGPFQVLIGSPQLHRWHHSKEKWNCNFSNYPPWLDVAFGTYYCPNAAPGSFGISEKIQLKYVALMLYPFQEWWRIAGRNTLCAELPSLKYSGLDHHGRNDIRSKKPAG